jgi:hypothetical protein
MGLEKLISIVSIFACLAVASGNLPKFIFAAQKAKLVLIENSKSSKWPKAQLLPMNKSRSLYL